MSGRVTLDGKPINGTLLIITHQASRQSFIEKVSNGQFAVKSPIWVGPCSIKLRPDEGDKKASPIPPKYRKEHTSELKVDVKEGPNEVDLALTSS